MVPGVCHSNCYADLALIFFLLWIITFTWLRCWILPLGIWSLLWYTLGFTFVQLSNLCTHCDLWLIIYSCTSRSRFFHLYGDVTIAGEGLQNLGLCSALRDFEQGGIFIVPHLLWHGTSDFLVSSEGPPQSVASYDTWECGGPILTRILTGPISVAFYDTHGDVEDLF
jgi:hypothetical protein